MKGTYKIKDDEGTKRYSTFEDLPKWAQKGMMEKRDFLVSAYKAGYVFTVIGVFNCICTAVATYTGEIFDYPAYVAMEAFAIPGIFSGAYAIRRGMRNIEKIPKKAKVKKKAKKARVPKKVSKPVPEPVPEAQETGYFALRPSEEKEQWRVAGKISNSENPPPKAFK